MQTTFNIITGQRKNVPDYTPLNDQELRLNSYFTDKIIELNSYQDARSDVITKIVRENDINQVVLDQLSDIKNKHFGALPSDIQDCNELRENLLNKEIILDCLNHLSISLNPIVNTMSNQNLDTLISISEQFPYLVYYSLQPAFILVLGIKTFRESIPLLFHKGNFVKLLRYSKTALSSLTWWDFFPTRITTVTFGLITVSAIATPLLLYWYNSKNTLQPIIEPEQQKNKVIMLPAPVSSNRIGGEFSNRVDKLADGVRKATAELMVLALAVPEGILDVLGSKYSGIIITMATKALQKCGYDVELKRNDTSPPDNSELDIDVTSPPDNSESEGDESPNE